MPAHLLQDAIKLLVVHNALHDGRVLESSTEKFIWVAVELDGLLLQNPILETLHLPVALEDGLLVLALAGSVQQHRLARDAVEMDVTPLSTLHLLLPDVRSTARL